MPRENPRKTAHKANRASRSANRDEQRLHARSTWIALASALASGCAIALSCGGAGPGERPIASLAQTQSAQEAFRPLRARWIAGTREDRAALEPNLVWFLGRYPDDDLAQVTTVYLAWIAIDRGDLARARELIAGVVRGPSGTTRDYAELAEAAILRRQGNAAAALERLEPLVGKVIDPYARSVFDEELVRAAIGAGRWYEAIAYMDRWLQQAEADDLPAVRSEVEQMVASAPGDVVASIVRTIRAEKARAGYGDEIRKALVARLEGDAGTPGDAPLVRGPARVEGRTVGLLLSLAGDALRARGADALAGVMEGLGLPGAVDAGPSVRLVTRDDAGDPARTEAALEALAADGAAVVVAGLDGRQAEAAARFAERTATPIVLLAAPSDGGRADTVFLAAGGEGEVPRLLGRALADRGAKRIATVGGDVEASDAGAGAGEAVSCDPPTAAGEPRFPIAAWQKGKIDGLLLLGGTSCAREAAHRLLATRLPFVAAAGLDAAALAWEAPPKLTLLVAATGRFPAAHGARAAPFAGWFDRHGAPPSYLAALARDAAVLAGAALATLSDSVAEQSADVRARHLEAAHALESAEAELWTTDARGFGATHALARAFHALEIR